jgi:t-SNARE complex subunit (syntaxin)
MDKVIERGEKIEILVKKSETMSDQSLDMKNTARRVKNKMWWKNKKVLIGIGIVVVILIAIIIWVIVG